MKIRKASGETEEFSRAKFVRSLRRTGASGEEAERVADEVRFYPLMSTRELYREARRKLRGEASANYGTRDALMALGPAGYLFEAYVGALLKEYGYETRKGGMVKGRCVSHEIDLVAKKDGRSWILELKYHNKRGVMSDVKTAMYLYARFLDIHALHENEKLHAPWLITNTKFTRSAIRYADCMGVKMTGWKEPAHTCLQALVEKKGLWPVTVLSQVGERERDRFASSGVLFARDAAKKTPEEIQTMLGVDRKKAERIAKEAKGLA